jgi:hypothetical protein
MLTSDHSVYHFDKLGAFLGTFETVCWPPKSHGIPAPNVLQLGDPDGAIMAGSKVEIRSHQHRNASYVLFANLMLTKTVEVVNGWVRVPSAIGTTGVVAMVSPLTGSLTLSFGYPLMCM